MSRVINRRLLLSTVLVGTFFICTASLGLAQDTSKLASERCTECHTASRWEDAKKTEKQWASIVDQMVRYGAQLSNEESALVVEYLAAKSAGKIKQPTTTTSVAKPKSVTTVAASKGGINGVKTTTTTVLISPSTTVVVNAVTTSTTQVSVPGEQAQTGVEMVWYILGGGMLIATGLSMRNKDKQLEK
ncbi:MAG TPA: hypothetical protein VE439_07090 [Anaerolineae bacterium]|jgi:hypothetical protein|nr:hypothetical protein [Anaerolineae bacterium]